ncbi:hypothetical protein H5410_006524 [Solanum commersonii]|uniref:Uncharacterized protein n=1 Tax=Solanum commersonii TaxID=4109 RepID=A0A9J6AAQ9_SOLCO|nr:hypothetical protein H5410_006524 [Solanum commersonii]
MSFGNRSLKTKACMIVVTSNPVTVSVEKTTYHFNNTSGEVVATKGKKREMLGTPTETAILEFGLALGGDFQAERQAGKLVKLNHSTLLRS